MGDNERQRKQLELDSILDAALDELDSDEDDDPTNSRENDYKVSSELDNNCLGEGGSSDSATASAVTRQDSNTCNNGSLAMGVPYSLEYIASNQQASQIQMSTHTNTTTNTNNNLINNSTQNHKQRRRFGPEPPPPPTSTDSIIPPFDLGAMLGGSESNETEFAASLESMMRQFTDELGGVDVGSIINSGNNNDNSSNEETKALDESLKKMMMGTANQAASYKSKRTNPRKDNSASKRNDEPNNVDESINRLLDGINQAASAPPPSNSTNGPHLYPNNMMPDKIDPSQSLEQFSEEMMSSMMNEFEKMGNKNDSNDVVDGVMKQLLAKELMYQPMKDVCLRFPKYLAENKEQMSKDDYDRFGSQYQYFQKIVRVYEEEGSDGLGDGINFDRLMELMQEIQEYGQPPVEIIKDLAPDLDFDDEG